MPLVDCRFSCTSSFPTSSEADAKPLDESILDKDQLAELFAGRFPSNFSGEEICIRTTRYEFDKIFKAFCETSPESAIPLIGFLSICMLISNTLTRTKRSVRVEFHKNISMTAVRQKQTEAHECITGEVSSRLRRLLPNDRFIVLGNTGLGAGLSTPDIQLIYQQKEPKYDNLPVLAIEVGFSQHTEDLKQKAKALVRKSAVNIAIMIDIKETPKYKNPLNTEDNIERFKSLRALQPEDDGDSLKNNTSPNSSPSLPLRASMGRDIDCSCSNFRKGPCHWGRCREDKGDCK